MVLFDLGEVVEDLLAGTPGRRRSCRQARCRSRRCGRRCHGRSARRRGSDACTDSLPSSKKPLWVTCCAEADAVHAAAKAQRHHDSDHDVSVSVHRSTPPGEHVSSLLILVTLLSAFACFSCQAREVSSEDSGRNGCSHAPCSGSESRPIRGSGSRKTPGMSSRSTNSKVSDANAQLACSRNPSTWTGYAVAGDFLERQSERLSVRGGDAHAGQPLAVAQRDVVEHVASTSLSSSILGLANTAKPTLRNASTHGRTTSALPGRCW